MRFLSINNNRAYILASALALSLAGCAVKKSPSYVEVLIDAPKKGTSFIVLNSLGNSVAEGKTPEKIALDRNFLVYWGAPSFAGPYYRPTIYSSQYTIVYTTPDGKKHGQAVYVDKINRVMLNIRQ